MSPIVHATFPLPAVQKYLEHQGGSVRRPAPDEARFDVSTPFGIVPVRVCFLAEEDLLTVSAFSRERVPSSRSGDAQALIARFNYDAPGAAWLSYDAKDGEVSARAALPLASRSTTTALVRELVEAAVHLVGEAIPFLPGVEIGPKVAVPAHHKPRDLN